MSAINIGLLAHSFEEKFLSILESLLVTLTLIKSTVRFQSNKKTNNEQNFICLKHLITIFVTILWNTSAFY